MCVCNGWGGVEVGGWGGAPPDSSFLKAAALPDPQAPPPSILPGFHPPTSCLLLLLPCQCSQCRIEGSNQRIKPANSCPPPHSSPPLHHSSYKADFKRREAEAVSPLASSGRHLAVRGERSRYPLSSLLSSLRRRTTGDKGGKRGRFRLSC